MRKFQSLKKGKSGVFAFQYFVNIMGGDPPFYQLALLGGTKRVRGYYEGRYRDKNAMSTQVEYRSPFWRNRIGFAAFTGTGLVFHNFADFDLHYLKPSLGGGLRLKFNRKENIHFRIDVAYGKSLNYYFILSEAF
jgi:hemolysin activation/secretion protein